MVKETELKSTLDSLGKKPALVITDSQAFKEVDKDTPSDILLTSFSILFARYKGNLETVVRGARALDTLEDGDTILISEAAPTIVSVTISVLSNCLAGYANIPEKTCPLNLPAEPNFLWI